MLRKSRESNTRLRWENEETNKASSKRLITIFKFSSSPPIEKSFRLFPSSFFHFHFLFHFLWLFIMKWPLLGHWSFLRFSASPLYRQQAQSISQASFTLLCGLRPLFSFSLFLNVQSLECVKQDDPQPFYSHPLTCCIIFLFFSFSFFFLLYSPCKKTHCCWLVNNRSKQLFNLTSSILFSLFCFVSLLQLFFLFWGVRPALDKWMFSLFSLLCCVHRLLCLA